MSEIERGSQPVSVTVHSTVASASVVRLDDFAGSLAMFDSVNASAATLNFYVSQSADGTFRLLTDGYGNAVTVILPTPGATPVAFPMPDGLFAAEYCKIVPTTSAIDGETLTLSVKS